MNLKCTFSVSVALKPMPKMQHSAGKMCRESSLLKVSVSAPHPLAIGYQVILDAAFGAPVLGQLVLCDLLQVKHCHLGWPAPHSATRGPLQVVPGAFALRDSVGLPVFSFFFVLVPRLSFFLGRVVGCRFVVVPFLTPVLLLLACWRKFCSDHLEDEYYENKFS